MSSTKHQCSGQMSTKRICMHEQRDPYTVTVEFKRRNCKRNANLAREEEVVQ